MSIQQQETSRASVNWDAVCLGQAVDVSMSKSSAHFLISLPRRHQKSVHRGGYLQVIEYRQLESAVTSSGVYSGRAIVTK